MDGADAVHYLFMRIVLMCVYFSHDVNAQRDAKCLRLIQELGYEGYGIFWAIIERMAETKDCKLETDFDILAWSMHIDREQLVQVVTEYGLFVMSEDGEYFWSESAKKRHELRANAGRPKHGPVATVPAPPARKRGRPRKNPLPEQTAVEPAVEPVPEVQEAAPVQDTTTAEHTGIVEPETVEPESEQEPEVEQTMQIPAECIVDAWNEAFGDTVQRYRGFTLDAISFDNARRAFALGYTLEDIKKAIKQAQREPFAWLLKHVLKPDNIQLLLTKGKQNDKQPSSGISKPSGGSGWSLPANWENLVHDEYSGGTPTDESGTTVVF